MLNTITHSVKYANLCKAFCNAWLAKNVTKSNPVLPRVLNRWNAIAFVDKIGQRQREGSDLQSKDAVDLAFKHADVATKSLQFFVVASVAVGGWIISSDQLRQTEPFSNPRLAWAALYLCIGTLTWFVHSNIMKRLDACFELANKLAEDELRQDAAFAQITKVPPRIGTNLGLPILILLVVMLILGFGDNGMFVSSSP